MAPSKPIQEQIYKSRLTITYRTTITGTLQEETLPFRLLVLGAFAGRSLRDAKLLDDLPKRQVRTIKRGKSVDYHLAEVLPVWRIPPNSENPSPQLKNLQSTIPGTVKIGSITVTVPGGLPDQAKALRLHGTVLFSSDHSENGFCDFEEQPLKITGDIDVTGPSESPKWGKAKILIHDVATGDRLDPVTRAPSGKVVGLADHLAIGDNGEIDASGWEASLIEDDGDSDFSSGDTGGKPKPQEWKLVPKDATSTLKVKLERVVPFASMDSFSPDAVAENIPEIERVRLLKRLLARLQSHLRNRPDLRAEIKTLLPGPEDKPDDRTKKIAQFKALQTWVTAKLGALKLEMPPADAKPVTLDAGVEDTVKGLQDKLVAPMNATSMDIYVPDEATKKPTPEPWAIVRRLPSEGMPLKFDDRDPSISDAAWLMNGLAVFLANSDLAAKEIRRLDGRKPDPDKALDECLGSYPQFLNATTTLMRLVDEKIRAYFDAVYHHPEFQKLESVWRGLADLAAGVESDDVFIDFVDVGKDELRNDLVDHDLDMFSGEIFNKVYIGEYDRYGGKPFAAMIGLFQFHSTNDDVAFLRAMGRVANASHCPFIAAASPDFFSPYKTIEEVAEISDLDAVLSEPQFGKWQELRDTEYAAYLGLTLPRYLVREPWKPDVLSNEIGYRETVPFFHAAMPADERNGIHDDAALKENLLWGNAAILFAKNMVASYQSSGWAQYIRGPRGGGLCEGLISYKYTRNGYEEIQPPVEIAIPDYRELQFATNGFIPLVHKKGEAVATFFSAQSLKKPKKFVEDLGTKNAALVTNLAYTFSITRIAHYVKRMMREYIGASADGPYIQKVLAAWLGQYVTIVNNPDDLTLRYYPFKAATIDVQPKPGPLGWYKATIKILPHVQFEGMDVELQLEAALGGP